MPIFLRRKSAGYSQNLTIFSLGEAVSERGMPLAATAVGSLPGRRLNLRRIASLGNGPLFPDGISEEAQLV
jgi:hypothetical protein